MRLFHLWTLPLFALSCAVAAFEAGSAPADVADHINFSPTVSPADAQDGELKRLTSANSNDIDFKGDLLKLFRNLYEDIVNSKEEMPGMEIKRSTTDVSRISSENDEGAGQLGQRQLTSDPANIEGDHLKLLRILQSSLWDSDDPEVERITSDRLLPNHYSTGPSVPDEGAKLR